VHSQDRDQLYLTRKDNPDAFWSAVRTIVASHTRGDEDCTQDAMIRVLEGLPRYQPRDGISITHWLAQIARNARVDSYRRRKARPEEQYPVKPDGSDLEIADYAGQGDGLVLLPDSLPGVDRRFTELILAGYKIGEAATQLGLSPAAGRKRLQRLKERFSSADVTVRQPSDV
jgi:RNA polymerase sigma factor (sigma-70 family)